MKKTIRNTTARLIAPVLRLSGFRFSKAYRNGETRFHRVVYSCVNVVAANIAAEDR
jgi:hypothetical protein